MPLRDFTDAAGCTWTVWAVRPTSDVRLRSTRNAGERDDLLRDGWLVFESAGQRRRLAPIPLAWDTVPDTVLESLCGNAEPVPARRRLID